MTGRVTKYAQRRGELCCTAVIPGYTEIVKTAISVPDATFARVEEAARRLGMSRSQIFARAVTRYLDELDADSIPERINAALDAAGGCDQSNRDALEHAYAMLAGVEW